jgi:hypothetical protein
MRKRELSGLTLNIGLLARAARLRRARRLELERRVRVETCGKKRPPAGY